MPEIIHTQPYLTAREVATLLRRSLTTIWRLTQRPVDPLPGRRLGGTLLFVRDEVTQWVNRQERITPLKQEGATHR
jgi:predicted DNA-binding transcriptional regulator AlpA